MSSFNEFMGTTKKLAGKAATKAAGIADITAEKIKIKAEKTRLCEAYEKLGRAAYQMLSEAETVSEDIADALDEIASSKSKLKELDKALKKKQEKYKEAENGDECDDCGCECNCESESGESTEE